MVDYSRYTYMDFVEKLERFKEKNGNVTEKEEAILFAQIVKQYTLDDPLSAVFSPVNEFHAVKTESGYRVTGAVVLKNNFGAAVRLPFTVNVSKKDGMWCCSDEVAFSSPHSEKKRKYTVAYRILAIIGVIAVCCIIWKITA